MDCQGGQEEPEEGQDDQGTLQELRRVPPSSLLFPGPPGVPSGSSWATWQTSKLALS